MIKKINTNNIKSRKIERLKKIFMKEITNIISKEVKDPGIQALSSILDVHLSKDLRIVYVKIRIFSTNKRNINKTLQALRRSSGYISSLVGSNLGLRYSPEIRFDPINDDEYYNIWLNQLIDDETC
ncbi:ribosome-binding factor A [Brevinema andersonii]|uniref:Ribosome-binding factor A n=1 Tax=Brevinema andersonii TaxID=34097 RepID=A0A1I1DQP5_BREAD|nr:30S ribosome-binding factor RbfA [Brevinema andersonii]SFB77285.1 ribosome-binding factor A [Brevinema andersonii]